jgi:hypothetical protein
MSFTQDELQALNAILDQKTAELLSELERLFDQRMHNLRKELEHQRKRVEESIERSFAVQLLAFEQLAKQHFSASGEGRMGESLHSPQHVDYADQPQASFEAIEVQTEIPWEDLIDLFNKALNEQFTTFDTSLQARLRDLEQEVSSQIQFLRKEQTTASSADSTEVEMQDILTNISQLERIVESMQVAMAANSTLLSHRLSHHQRLPMERAHPVDSLSPTEEEMS